MEPAVNLPEPSSDRAGNPPVGRRHGGADARRVPQGGRRGVVQRPRRRAARGRHLPDLAAAVRHLHDLRRQLHPRPLRAADEVAGGDRLARLDPAVGRLHALGPHDPLRIPGADRAVDHRHVRDGVGERPDHALSRARAAEPRGLRAGLDPARFGARHRGGPEVFRPRRARLRHAALRRLADLRLHRHGELPRDRPRDGLGRGADRPRLRHDVPARGPRLQDLGRAVPHVDAGRLRGRADAGHGVLLGRARRSPPSRCSCASSSRASRRSSSSGSRSSSSSRSLR